MFKNETLVKWFVCSLLVLIFTSDSLLAANGPDRYRSRDRDRETSLDGSIWDDMCSTAELRSQNKTTCDNLINKAEGGSTADMCKTAVPDFQKARDEFRSSCKGLPTKSISGNIACGWHIAQCDCPSISYATEPDAYQKLECASAQTSSSSSRSQRDIELGLLDNEASRAKYGHCALAAATDKEKLEKEIREAQKELREAQKKIPELEQSIADAQSQMREKMQQAKQQMADAAKERAQQRADYIKQQREQMKTIAQQVTSLQEQITRNEESRSQITLSRQDAELARQDAVSQIEATCHTQAISTVTTMQQERLQLAKARDFNRGNFNQMLRNVGISDRTAWQRVAKEHYLRCMQSAVTRSAIKSANKKYQVVLNKADQSERDLDKRRKSLEVQVRQLQNPEQCQSRTDLISLLFSFAFPPAWGNDGMNANGTTTESQACQAIRQRNEDIARAEADYRIKQQLNAENYATAQRDGAQRISSKARELAEANNVIREERDRLNNLRKALDLKRQFSQGGSMDSKEAGEARDKHQKMVTASYNVLICFNKAKCSSNAACKDARDYLYETLGRRNLQYKDSRSIDPEPVPRSPSPSAPENRDRQGTGTGTRG